MSTQEKWLPVVGYEGIYEVSDMGRVRSMDRHVRHPRGGVKRVRGRLLAQKRHGGGYRQVTLSREGSQSYPLVHALVLEAFDKPRPVGLEVRHRNGNGLDNRRTNLAWGTHSENEIDKIAHGTHRQTRKTHCSRQHVLAEPNLLARALRFGYRECRSCGLVLKKVRLHEVGESRVRVLADEMYAKIMGGLT